MYRTAALFIVLLTLSTALGAEEKKAPALPATPQESAERYFAAMASDKAPDPAPMMVSKFKMSADQVAGHARMVAAQLKDKAMKPQIIVAGEKLARIIGTEIMHSNGQKSVIYIDVEKEGEGWLICDVNCLVSTEVKNIIQGFKEMKDAKAKVTTIVPK